MYVCMYVCMYASECKSLCLVCTGSGAIAVQAHKCAPHNALYVCMHARVFMRAALQVARFVKEHDSTRAVMASSAPTLHANGHLPAQGERKT